MLTKPFDPLKLAADVAAALTGLTFWEQWQAGEVTGEGSP